MLNFMQKIRKSRLTVLQKKALLTDPRNHGRTDGRTDGRRSFYRTFSFKERGSKNQNKMIKGSPEKCFIDTQTEMILQYLPSPSKGSGSKKKVAFGNNSYEKF